MMNILKDTQKNSEFNFIFLGTDSFSVNVAKEMKKNGFMPKAIICAPDRPSGRGQKIQKPEMKIWGEENGVSIFQPEKLNSDFIMTIKDFANEISIKQFDFFVVASYGKIIPQAVLDLPKFGSLNVHPSLLPKYRGASPIESAILDNEKNTGVTILLVDAEMDHGPIISKKEVLFEKWPAKTEVENILAKTGGEILSEAIPKYINGEIKPIEQKHNEATFTKKISKEMGQILQSIDLMEDHESWGKIPKESQLEIFLKIQALNPWPGVFFFITHKDKKIRVKITSATFENETLKIEKVIPEGGKEISYADFCRGFLKSKK